MNPIDIALPLVILSTIFSSFADLFLKEGSGNIFRLKSLIKDHKFMFGVLLSVLSFFPFVIALKFVDLSLAYPLKALSFVWVILLSRIYLKEEIDRAKILASFLIITGIILLSLTV